MRLPIKLYVFLSAILVPLAAIANGGGVMAKKKEKKKTTRERIAEMLEINARGCESSAEIFLKSALSRLQMHEDVDDVMGDIDNVVANLFEARGHRNAACDIREKEDV